MDALGLLLGLHADHDDVVHGQLHAASAGAVGTSLREGPVGVDALGLGRVHVGTLLRGRKRELVAENAGEEAH